MKKDRKKKIEVAVKYTKLITQFLLCNRCFSDSCRSFPWQKGGEKILNTSKIPKLEGRFGTVK